MNAPIDSDDESDDEIQKGRKPNMPRVTNVESKPVAHKRVSTRSTPKSSNGQIICRYCPQKFLNHQGLSSHMRTRHSRLMALSKKNDPEIFYCCEFPKKYDKFPSLQKHSLMLHGHTVLRTAYDSNKQKRKEKPEASKSARLSERVVQKVPGSDKTTSISNDSLKCDKCNKEFATVDFLNKHKLTHSNTPLNCPHCGEVFKQSELLKKHLDDKECASENDEDSIDSLMEERPIHVNKKRTIGFEENSERLANAPNFVTPPVAKKTIVKIEPEVVILKPETVVDDLFEIKKPPVAKKTTVKIEPEVVILEPETVVDDLFEIKKESRGMTQVQSKNNSDSRSTIEKFPLPLSTGIFTRTVQFPNELMIVWSYSLEEDLLAAVSMNKRNSILCVQELETLNLPKLQRDLLSKSQMVTFNMLDSNDTFTPWTVIYFGEANCPTGLKKKLFRNFVDVEKTLSEHAASRGMVIKNVMRYSEDGLFPLLSKSLKQMLTVFNFIE